MRISKATWVTAGVLLVSLGLAAVLSNGVKDESSADGVTALVPVRVIALKREAGPGEVTVGGFLRARNDITISAERGGRVVAFPVAEGKPVAKGGVVARLDDTVAAADLAQARAAAREAALDPDLPAAELQRARSSLRRAEYEFTLRNPAAPIAGTVEKHHVDVGEYVVPGTPLVDVLDTGALIFDADVDAEVVPLLDETGATVLALGKSIPARVVRIAGRADRSTRRFRIELEIEPSGLRPGMYAEARFVLPAGEPAFYVPKAAVRRMHGERGVFVVRDGLATWVPLQLEGVHHLQKVWRATGGLVDGDPLVVAGFSGLQPGVAVQVQR